LIPGHIHNANLTLKAPEGMDNCGDLNVFAREADGVVYFSSEWVPSAAERELIAKGASVTLTVVGMHPPVALSVIDTLLRAD